MVCFVVVVGFLEDLVDECDFLIIDRSSNFVDKAGENREAFRRRVG